MSHIVKKARAEDSVRILLAKGRAVFFTLTTPDEVSYKEISGRWRSLRHWLLRRLHHPSYVMNYELHPGYLQKEVAIETGEVVVIHGSGLPHGWHIHGVVSDFIPLRSFLSKIHEFGFGRVDVRRVYSSGVYDYLTKHALKAYNGLSRRYREIYKGGRFRLVNVSRDLPSLSSYEFTSDLIRRARSIFNEFKYDCVVAPSFSQVRKAVLVSRMLALSGFSHYHDWPKLFHCQSQAERKN